MQRKRVRLAKESPLKNLLTSGRRLRRFWIVASIAWIAFIPLDAAGGGGELQIAAKAVPKHNLRTGLLTLGMPPPAGRVGCVFCRLSREPAANFVAVEHPNGGPSRILLMRHADKPEDPYDSDLSDAGMARAEHLATYIPQTFGKPDYIIATAHSKHSNRPTETVKPLADALGIKVQHDSRTMTSRNSSRKFSRTSPITAKQLSYAGITESCRQLRPFSELRQAAILIHGLRTPTTSS